MATIHRKSQESNMKHIGIKDYKKVYFDYMMSDRELMDFIDDRSKDRDRRVPDPKVIHKTMYVYDGKNYSVTDKKSHNGYDLLIKRNTRACLNTSIHVVINSVTGIAFMKPIDQSYGKSAVGINMLRYEHSSFLLKACVQFLRDNREKYGANRIVANNSCIVKVDSHDGIPTRTIHTEMLHILMYGDTWYVAHGFKPYDYYNNELYAKHDEAHDRNLAITHTPIKYTDILKCIETCAATGDIEESVAARIKKIYAECQDVTVMEFFRNVRDEIFLNPEAYYLYYGLWIDLFMGLMLRDFQHYSFYLDI